MPFGSRERSRSGEKSRSETIATMLSPQVTPAQAPTPHRGLPAVHNPVPACRSSTAGSARASKQPGGGRTLRGVDTRYPQPCTCLPFIHSRAGSAFRAAGGGRTLPYVDILASPHVLVDLAACAWATALAVVDLRERRLPRTLTLPAYVVGGACLLVALTTGGRAVLPIVVAAITGAVALRCVYVVARALSPGGAGLGRGDVTLSAPLGGWLAWHGWEALLVGAWAGFALSGLIAAALLLARRVDRDTALPHGPPMLLGAVLAVAAAHVG